MNSKDIEALDELPRFESIVDNVLLSGRLYSLYDSKKWDSPSRIDKAKGRKPRNKNHRG